MAVDRPVGDDQEISFSSSPFFSSVAHSWRGLAALFEEVDFFFGVGATALLAKHIGEHVSCPSFRGAELPPMYSTVHTPKTKE